MNRTFVCLWVSCAMLAPWATAAQVPADPNSPGGTVVAKIGDFAITRDELSRRLMQEVRPHESQFYRPSEPVTTAAVLRTMVAEKAMSVEGRKLGYLSDEQIYTSVVQFEQQRLVMRLLETELEGKATVEDADIDQAQKQNPKASREQAKMVAQRAKAMRLLEQFYGQITEKRKLTKAAENVAKTAQLHQRLLNQPREPRGPGEYWIRNSQINSDLSDEEKNLVLATYEGGQYTAKDLFVALCNMAPPRRPRDLDTPQGVEKLLDLALRGPILAVEARSRGYDKDAKLRSEIKTLEDQRLLDKMQTEKSKGVKEPTAEEVKAQFEKDPQQFATNPILKTDQIWCEDLETARKVKGMLAEGADFQALKKDHSLQKNVEFYSASPGSEGIFWADLWKGEPNQVVGPVPGFYDSGVKWRVVKILEKTPPKVQPFSEQLAGSVKWEIYEERRQRALREYESELLAKYPHEVFAETLKAKDPLAEITMKPADESAQPGKDQSNPPGSEEG